MSLNAEERQEILQLLAAGKLTVDEAAALLAGAKQPEPMTEPQSATEDVVEKEPGPSAEVDDLVKVAPDAGAQQTPKNGDSGPSWLHVRVTDVNTGKNKVTVNVPLRLVRYGLAIGRRYAPELDALDWNQISGFLSAEKGMLVEVEDQEDGEHVQIYVD
jgi:hypothetical protein